MKTFQLRTLLATLLVVFLAAAADAQSTQKPNILVILTDDQGWADIGYNNPNVYTPNLDKLAAEGAKLTQHYVMPQCTPTRLALFTGRYPGRFGISGLQASNRPIIPHGTLTMASFLKANGYRTYLTGKWHLGSWAEHGPNHHGFDYSYGALAGAVGAYVHTYRAPQQVHVNSITWHRNHKIITNYENGEHVTDLVTDDAIRVIKEKKDAPFFLYLPYFAPHTPLDERGKFVKNPTQLDGDNPDRWLNEDKIEWFNDPKGIIQKQNDPEKRLFLAVVHHLDNAIGRVVSALEESGQRENTIIFFSSDNGPQVNWNGGSYPSDLRLTDFNQPIPFRGSKTDVWEGGIHVPGFVNWPGKNQTKRNRLRSPHHRLAANHCRDHRRSGESSEWPTGFGWIRIFQAAVNGRASSGSRTRTLFATSSEPRQMGSTPRRLESCLLQQARTDSRKVAAVQFEIGPGRENQRRKRLSGQNCSPAQEVLGVPKRRLEAAQFPQLSRNLTTNEKLAE